MTPLDIYLDREADYGQSSVYFCSITNRDAEFTDFRFVAAKSLYDRSDPDIIAVISDNCPCDHTVDMLGAVRKHGSIALTKYSVDDRVRKIQQERDEYIGNWNQWAAKDFAKELVRKHGRLLKPDELRDLKSVPADRLLVLFESLNTNGDFYAQPNSDPILHRSVDKCTPARILDFLHIYRVELKDNASYFGAIAECGGGILANSPEDMARNTATRALTHARTLPETDKERRAVEKTVNEYFASLDASKQATPSPAPQPTPGRRPGM